MNGHLMASFQRNICTKNMIIFLKIIIENVWDVFGDTVYYDYDYYYYYCVQGAAVVRAAESDSNVNAKLPLSTTAAATSLLQTGVMANNGRFHSEMCVTPTTTGMYVLTVLLVESVKRVKDSA